MKRYLIVVFAIAVLVVGAVGAVNYLVDPFLLYRHRDGGDAMLGRIDQFYNMRLYKPYHVRRLKPQAVIVGTSRSGSIRPNHESWEELRRYNFAMPGMTIYEIDRLVKHAQAVQPLKQLLIGLDYHALVRAAPKYRPGFESDRFVERPEDFRSIQHIGQRLQDLQAFLFSLDMLGESARALAPAPDLPRVYYMDGAWKGVGRALVGRGGYIYVARSAVESRLMTPFRLEDNLPYLRDLLEFCYRNDIDTTLFFTPTHVFFVDLWYRIASQSLWRETHRRVLALNEEIAARHGRRPFEIWGFGDDGEIAAEPIYRARDIDQAWFMDGAHYGTRLAERIMDALLGPPGAFGRPLDTGNIDGYLDGVNALREQFIRSNRQAVDDLHRRIGNVPEMKD